MSLDTLTMPSTSSGLMGFDSQDYSPNPTSRINTNGNGHAYSHTNGNGNGNGNGHGHANGAGTSNGHATRRAFPQELANSLTQVKGQSQFLLYLADQIEESLGQLAVEDEDCQAAFLCKILTMYAGQLESKHRAVGEKIAEACGQVHSTVREFET